MNPLNDYPEARRALYVIQFVLGLALGATQVGYASADVGQPTWLTITIAVFTFLCAGLGFTAQANVDPNEDQ